MHAFARCARRAVLYSSDLNPRKADCGPPPAHESAFRGFTSAHATADPAFGLGDAAPERNSRMAAVAECGTS
jgi:hypothetical protein